MLLHQKRCHIAEHRDLNLHCPENLKSREFTLTRFLLGAVPIYSKIYITFEKRILVESWLKSFAYQNYFRKNLCFQLHSYIKYKITDATNNFGIRRQVSILNLE